MSSWDDAVAATIARCYASIEHDPQILLECDGGPVGKRAGIVVARMYGFDDELVAEVRLAEALLEYRMPLRDRLPVAADPVGLLPRAAIYRLQSAYASARISSICGAPHGIERDPATRLVEVLCLRYRRRA